MPLDHLRPNELNIQVKWTDDIRNMIKQPLAKINCHLSPEKLSHIKTVVTCHSNDKRNSYINSMCCDQNSIIYLCDTANNKIKMLNKNYSIDKCFVGSGKHNLIFPSILMSLPVSDKSTNDKNSATIIVSDPGSQNVVTFNQNGQGVDLFVTNGSSSSMCLVSHLNELENLQESSLELSPIYSSMDNFESQIDTPDQQAIVLCTKLDNLYLEFLQINPITTKLYKSRPDLMLALMDSGYSSLPNCMVWNSVSKYLFLLDSHEHKVLIFSGQNGRFIRFYGRFGAGNEEFNEPTNILVDKDGLVLISDMLNNRIHVLDSLGNFLRFLFPFSHKQPICNPTAMCFDNDNNLLICEKSGKMKMYIY